MKLQPTIEKARTNADSTRAVQTIRADREFSRRLETYVNLLRHWRKVTNLISEASFAEVWSRHIADSAQLIKYAPTARRWVDVGSGAGFPGIIIALQLQSLLNSSVQLIESDRRKCAFLREVARATSAPVLIHPGRVQMLDAEALGTVDAITARAFLSLPNLIESTSAWLSHGATGVFPCGRSAAEQIRAIATASDYSVEVFPSRLDLGTHVVRIRRAFEV